MNKLINSLISCTQQWSFVVTVIVLFVTIIPIQANQPNDECPQTSCLLAYQALSHATSSLLEQHKAEEIFGDLGFTQSLSDSEGNKTLAIYSPIKSIGKRWRTVSVTGKKLTKFSMPLPAFLSTHVINTFSLNYSKEEPDFWVFEGKMNINAEKESIDFDKHLTAYLRIDKTSHQIRQITFTSRKPFKPNAVTKISTFTMKANYEYIAPDYPPVAASMKMNIVGRYGVFITFEESAIQERSEWVLSGASEPALP